jgi:hypothetical protein
MKDDSASFLNQTMLNDIGLDLCSDFSFKY